MINEVNDNVLELYVHNVISLSSFIKIIKIEHFTQSLRVFIHLSNPSLCILHIRRLITVLTGTGASILPCYYTF